MEKKDPHPVPILIPNERGFLLDEKALKDVLLQDNIKDLNAVVISVTGASRRGRSFLLNFLLRYMNRTYSLNSSTEKDDCLGDEDTPLDGFSWKRGSIRDTTGIIIWSEVFCVTLPNGEKVAVIFLDTQGTLGNRSRNQDGTAVITLSTMLSSIEVYNLFQNIQEDDLQYLKSSTEYGRLVLEDTGNKPFQKLLCLVRDWGYPYEKNYGLEGGSEFLNEVLNISDDELQGKEKSLKADIKSCFNDIQCFLMPYPGTKVVTKREFDGRLSDIDHEFQVHLKQLVSSLLSPESLESAQKEIAGRNVKVQELVQYFKSYTALFNGDEFPSSQCMIKATVEVNNHVAVIAARMIYHQRMEEFCQHTESYQTPAKLEQEHIKYKNEAFTQFESMCKMDRDELSGKYKIMLEEEINLEYDGFKNSNMAKIPAGMLAVETAKEAYQQLMIEAVENTLYLSDNQLQEKHYECRNQALKEFERICGKGTQDISTSYRIELEHYINVNLDRFIIHNKVKAEATNRSALAVGRLSYHQLMAKRTEPLNADTLQRAYLKCREDALQEFKRNTKSDEDKYSRLFEKRLKKIIDNNYKNVRFSNQMKMEASYLLSCAMTKQKYNQLMEEACKSSEPRERHLSADELENEHIANKKKCMKVFKKNFKTNSPEYSKYINRMQNQIDIEYEEFKTTNSDKACANVITTVVPAKKTYDQLMSKFYKFTEPYLSPEELEYEHMKCKLEALDKFKNDLEMSTGGEFFRSRTTESEKDIEALYHQIQKLNNNKAEFSIQSAAKISRVFYRERMEEVCKRGGPHLSTEALQQEHIKYKSESLQQFERRAQMHNTTSTDPHRIGLEKVIDIYYYYCKIINKATAENSCILAYLSAKVTYHQLMSKTCKRHRSFAGCHYPFYLEEEQPICEAEALKQFRKNCVAEPDEFSVKYEAKLKQDIYKDHDELVASNETITSVLDYQLAIALSKLRYHQLIVNILKIPKSSEWFSKFKQEHNKSLDEAWETFQKNNSSNSKTLRSKNELEKVILWDYIFWFTHIVKSDETFKNILSGMSGSIFASNFGSMINAKIMEGIFKKTFGDSAVARGLGAIVNTDTFGGIFKNIFGGSSITNNIGSVISSSVIDGIFNDIVSGSSTSRNFAGMFNAEMIGDIFKDMIGSSDVARNLGAMINTNAIGNIFNGIFQGSANTGNLGAIINTGMIEGFFKGMFGDSANSVCERDPDATSRDFNPFFFN